MTPFPRCVVLRLRREGVDASIVLFSAVGEADARRIWSLDPTTGTLNPLMRS